MSKREDHYKQREEEARRALERIEAQSETLGTSALARAARAMSARDDGDQIELWGRRIGRGLAIVVAIGLIMYFTGIWPL